MTNEANIQIQVDDRDVNGLVGSLNNLREATTGAASGMQQLGTAATSANRQVASTNRGVQNLGRSSTNASAGTRRASADLSSLGRAASSSARGLAMSGAKMAAAGGAAVAAAGAVVAAVAAWEGLKIATQASAQALTAYITQSEATRSQLTALQEASKQLQLQFGKLIFDVLGGNEAFELLNEIVETAAQLIDAFRDTLDDLGGNLSLTEVFLDGARFTAALLLDVFVTLEGAALKLGTALRFVFDRDYTNSDRIRELGAINNLLDTQRNLIDQIRAGRVDLSRRSERDPIRIAVESAAAGGGGGGGQATTAEIVAETLAQAGFNRQEAEQRLEENRSANQQLFDEVLRPFMSEFSKFEQRAIENATRAYGVQAGVQMAEAFTEELFRRTDRGSRPAASFPRAVGTVVRDLERQSQLPALIEENEAEVERLRNQIRASEAEEARRRAEAEQAAANAREAAIGATAASNQARLQAAQARAAANLLEESIPQAMANLPTLGEQIARGIIEGAATGFVLQQGVSQGSVGISRGIERLGGGRPFATAAGRAIRAPFSGMMTATGTQMMRMGPLRVNPPLAIASSGVGAVSGALQAGMAPGPDEVANNMRFEAMAIRQAAAERAEAAEQQAEQNAQVAGFARERAVREEAAARDAARRGAATRADLEAELEIREARLMLLNVELEGGPLLMRERINTAADLGRLALKDLNDELREQNQLLTEQAAIPVGGDVVGAARSVAASREFSIETRGLRTGLGMRVGRGRRQALQALDGQMFASQAEAVDAATAALTRQERAWIRVNGNLQDYQKAVEDSKTLTREAFAADGIEAFEQSLFAVGAALGNAIGGGFDEGLSRAEKSRKVLFELLGSILVALGSTAIAQAGIVAFADPASGGLPRPGKAIALAAAGVAAVTAGTAFGAAAGNITGGARAGGDDQLAPSLGSGGGASGTSGQTTQIFVENRFGSRYDAREMDRAAAASFQRAAANGQA